MKQFEYFINLQCYSEYRYHFAKNVTLIVGQVESTEGIYKYHMQIQQASEENMSKARQVPLKLNLKPKRRLHSANSTASTIEDVPQSDTSQGDLSQVGY